MGIAVSAIGFGFVYGLSAREAGFSPIEVLAMSVLVFGGASQFAAVGYVASGLAWPGIVLLTALLNASCWFSAIENGIHIGSTCEIVVSSVSLAVTRLPSDFTERLESPVIGAIERV